MASKRELEKRIEELEAQVRRLENMHACIIPANSWQSTRFAASDPFEAYTHNGMEGRYCSRQLTAAELKTRWEHPLIKERTAWTKNIPDVTHEELARYVLDGKPIMRKSEEKVTYVTSHAPGEKNSSVKTKLGDISITEKERA